MKKGIKRIGMVWVLLLVMSFCCTAYAAAGDNGSITIYDKCRS